MTKNYHLYSASGTTTTANIATAQVVRDAKIVAVDIDYTGTGGAGIGHFQIEVALNSTVQLGGTNNPTREPILATLQGHTPNATATIGTRKLVPVNRPVKAGDVLAAHFYVLTGTNPAAGYVSVNVTVEE